MSLSNDTSFPIGDRLRIGECVVDVPLREVTAPGVRRARRLTPKSMGVLMVLVANAGKVVGREQLLAEVWPDTMPGDDVVTQAITQLRKAFGQQRDGDPYIETIAKTGYRLLAPVALQASEAAAPQAIAPATPAVDAPAGPGLAAPGPSEAPAPDRGWLRERVLVVTLAIVGALALVGVLAGLLMVRDGGEASAGASPADPVPAVPARPYRLLTSAPGFELAPTLSPDASMAAYSATLPGRRGTVIQVQTTDASQPRQISFPPDGVSDRQPAWSPDGREIAYIRYGPGDACHVLVTPANGGGSERSVTACDVSGLVSFGWSPDSRQLIFGSMGRGPQGAGLRLLELTTGQWRDVEGVWDGVSLDHDPGFSPDGKWIGFVRNPQIGDLWRVPAEGGTPEQLTHIGGEFRGWDWLPDGSGMVFGRRIDSEVRLYHLDLASGTIRDLGLDDAQSPSVARRAGVLAFVRRRPQFGLFRTEREGDDVEGAREHLFASSGRDTLPSLAPDGRQMVFASDRTGHFHLWWADLEQPNTLRQVEGVHPATHARPEWAPDSRRMLVVGHDEAGREGVFEVTPTRGQVSFLPMPGPRFRVLQAMYTPDPGRLLMTVRDEAGTLCLALLDRTTSPWRVVSKIEDVSLARVDASHARVLFTRPSENGLWEVDLGLAAGSIRKIDAERPVRWRFQAWAVAEDGSIDYIEPQPACLSSLRRIGVDDAVGHATHRCLDRDHLSATTGFTSSSRANVVISAQAVDDGTDIGLMAVPGGTATTPQVEVPGWIK